jgi:hypothetical protein
VLTLADEEHHIDTWAFQVPLVCGAMNLAKALRRISEGAAMIRSKGGAGTGNIVEFSTVAEASLSRSFRQPREWRGPLPRRSYRSAVRCSRTPVAVVSCVSRLRLSTPVEN